MEKENIMNLKFLSLSQNEIFARTVISAFCIPLNPSVAELNDIKTAVSEAVTNAIVHGYPDTEGYVNMTAKLVGNTLHIEIADDGVGIENLEQAMQPFYTTKPNDERSGMGFTIIESFMDDLSVLSGVNKGTVVKMSKTINSSL